MIEIRMLPKQEPGDIAWLLSCPPAGQVSNWHDLHIPERHLRIVCDQQRPA